MNREKSIIVSMLSHISGVLVILLGIVGFVVEFEAEKIEFSGVVLSTVCIILGVYLITSVYSKYFGGVPTIFGILMIGFSCFVIVYDIESEAEIGLGSIGAYFLLFAMGASLLYWGQKLHEKALKK